MCHWLYIRQQMTLLVWLRQCKDHQDNTSDWRSMHYHWWHFCNSCMLTSQVTTGKLHIKTCIHRIHRDGCCSFSCCPLPSSNATHHGARDIKWHMACSLISFGDWPMMRTWSQQSYKQELILTYQKAQMQLWDQAAIRVRLLVTLLMSWYVMLLSQHIKLMLNICSWPTPYAMHTM